MRILVVHLDDKINLCPPALNVIENLLDQGHKVYCVGYSITEIKEEILHNKNFKYYDIGEYISPNNKLKKYLIRFNSRVKIRKFIKENINKFDLVWTTSEITVREIGPILLQAKKHIMQLMELAEYVPQFGGYKFLKFNIQKYAENATKVVVPEINRAYIIKAWWGLKKMPIVLPNKPYSTEISHVSQQAKKAVEKVKNEKRKIILYQGGFTADRKFDNFIKAVDSMGEGYCLYLMGKDNQYRQSICDKYPNVKYLGYLMPPEHLLIAQYAQVGILTYVPVKDGFHSVLNALYCAPNKTYEYAYCKLPMVGTNVPGLKEIFDKYKVGACIKEDNVEGVINAIKYVEQNHSLMEKNCIKYFDSVNLKEIVKDIIS